MKQIIFGTRTSLVNNCLWMACAVFAWAAAEASSFAADKTLPLYQRFEQTLESAAAYPNPVQEASLTGESEAVLKDSAALDDPAPLAERVLVEAALALVDVVRADALDRLRDCEAEDCEGIFVDLSKNGSKRYCSARCGNRMNVRAYRERQA